MSQRIQRTLLLWLFVFSACGTKVEGNMNVLLADLSPQDARLAPTPDLSRGDTTARTTPGQGCLFASTGPLHFLPLAVGTQATLSVTLTSCDGMANRIVSATLDPPEAPFSLTDSEGKWDPAAEELPVPMWQQAHLQVIFAPTQTSPILDGVPLPFEATLRLDYRAELPGGPLSTLVIPLSGVALADNCVTPVLLHELQAGSPLAVRLDGLGSLSPLGPVTGWQWTVDGPEGALTAFHPSDHTATTVFASDTAGDYIVTLTVSDQQGTPQCPSEPLAVTLSGVLFEPAPPVPETGLEAMVLWRTPGDWHPDDGEAVSNVDLHLVHAWAGGPDLDGDGLPDGWFSTPYDCWAGNPGPHWGINEPGSTDDPEFFGDGEPEGPEQILLVNPEQETYRIGVHYADDEGLGPVFARVVVYLHGELVMATAETLLFEQDLWEVAAVHWPEQTVTPTLDASGNPKILNEYSNPYQQ
jgi:hypothetical protein